MRSVVCSLLAGAVVVAAGCWPQSALLPDPPPPPKVAVTPPRPPRPPVTVEQVNSGNAREMAEALLEEINGEQAAAAQKRVVVPENR